MNPIIINDDTPFFVIESVMCVSVGILEISAIFNVYHFSQISHLQVKSFIQNMCWWIHHIIEIGTVCFKYDFYILSLLSFSCNNSDRNFLNKKVCIFCINHRWCFLLQNCVIKWATYMMLSLWLSSWLFLVPSVEFAATYKAFGGVAFRS